MHPLFFPLVTLCERQGGDEVSLSRTVRSRVPVTDPDPLVTGAQTGAH
jgi:hypothetical protein